MSKIYFHLDCTFCSTVERCVSHGVPTELWCLHGISCLIAQGRPNVTLLARRLRSAHLLRPGTDRQLGKQGQIQRNIPLKASHLWQNLDVNKVGKSGQKQSSESTETWFTVWWRKTTSLCVWPVAVIIIWSESKTKKRQNYQLVSSLIKDTSLMHSYLFMSPN